MRISTRLRAAGAARSTDLPKLPPAWIVRGLQGLRNRVSDVHRAMTPPPVAILEALAGIVANKALGVVAELDIAEHLSGGPRGVGELARACGADANSLDRILRALVGLGFFRVERDGRYANNPASELLRAGHGQSMRDFVLFFSSPWVWELFTHAPFATRTGKSGVVETHGCGFFTYLHRHADIGPRWDRAMASSSRVNAAILAGHFDFSDYGRVCDLGGGTGTSLCEMLHRNPHLRGVLFEVPIVAERARATIENAGLSDRAEIVGGDFFEHVPGGCDLYSLQAVLHDWNDDECVQILARIREVEPQASVLVLESVRPEHDRYDFTKLVDVWMLLAVGSGGERSVAQWEALFERAGYAVARRRPLPTLFEAFELSSK